MLEKSANLIYNIFGIKKVTDNNKEDLYKYGIQVFLSNIIEVFFCLIIGLALSSVKEVIVLLLSFIITRRFTGGYHAKTFGKCTLLTCGVILSALLIYKYVDIPFYICAIVGIISYLIFSLFVPVENENKKLDGELKIKCRFKALFVLSLQVIAGIILCYFNISLYRIIFISLFFVNAFIIISFEKKGDKRNEEDCFKVGC